MSRLERARSLIEALNDGRITLEQARAQMPEFGEHAGKAELHPARREFNPWLQKSWSLAMAVAWVAVRYPDQFAVREHLLRLRWKAYRQQCFRLTTREATGAPADSARPTCRYQLAPFDPLSLGHDRAFADGEEPDAGRWRDAFAEIWQALMEGSLTAKGVERKSGNLRAIGAEEFALLTPVRSMNWDEMCSLRREADVAYDHVRVARSQVEAKWSPGVWIDRETGEWSREISLDALPEGRHDIPVALAVAWVATEAGLLSVRENDQERWRKSRVDVFSRIASGELPATGEAASGRRCRIDPAEFSDIRYEEQPILPRAKQHRRKPIRFVACGIWQGWQGEDAEPECSLMLGAQRLYGQICVPTDAVRSHWNREWFSTEQRAKAVVAGGNSFAAQDAVLVEKMRALIMKGAAANTTQAAQKVASEARRLGSPDSVVERLRRRYGEKYPARRRR